MPVVRGGYHRLINRSREVQRPRDTNSNRPSSRHRQGGTAYPRSLLILTTISEQDRRTQCHKRPSPARQLENKQGFKRSSSNASPLRREYHSEVRGRCHKDQSGLCSEL